MKKDFRIQLSEYPELETVLCYGIMEPPDRKDGDRSEGPFLDSWPEEEIWFRDFVRDELVWGTEDVLKPVPESKEGVYGVQLAGDALFNGRNYSRSEFVVVETREELLDLLVKVPAISGVIFPWYDRIVPLGLVVKHQEKIELGKYRAALQSSIQKSVLITIGAIAAAWYFPTMIMIALLAGTMYGLFPLVDGMMEYFRRVDKLSVYELNRRAVNFELFRRWMIEQPVRPLVIGVAVLILVLLLQYYVGLRESSIQAALVKRAVVENGEWWRIVTSGLMHGGLLHLLFNGMAFYNLGQVILGLTGTARFYVVFLFSVVCGSLASLWFKGMESLPTVGASGGILGCLGFLLVISWKFRDELPRFLFANCVRASIVMAIFGMLGYQFIDNAAHAGGFAAGVLLGLVFYPALKLADGKVSLPVRILSWLSLGILGAGVVKVGFKLWKIASF